MLACLWNGLKGGWQKMRRLLCHRQAAIYHPHHPEKEQTRVKFNERMIFR
jgi:hypothetical protein